MIPTDATPSPSDGATCHDREPKARPAPIAAAANRDRHTKRRSIIGGLLARAEERARFDDLAFLAKVQSATLDELQQLVPLCFRSSAPAWRRVAVRRAIARQLADDLRTRPG